RPGWSTPVRNEFGGSASRASASWSRGNPNHRSRSVGSVKACHVTSSGAGITYDDVCSRSPDPDARERSDAFTIPPPLRRSTTAPSAATRCQAHGLLAPLHSRPMTQRFTDKVALVTGAASGMGRAITIRLAEEGASVFAADIDQAGLDETAKLASG